jgi:hypothetical protein
LPADLPRNLTHTVGAQSERTVAGTRYVANPISDDFVPDGSAVVTRREVTTTAQCNACHDPLALHGGGRREVKLCQLCHTDQAIDPESGNQIDLKHMVHRIHMGKKAPGRRRGRRRAPHRLPGSEALYAEKADVREQPVRATLRSDADCAEPLPAPRPRRRVPRTSELHRVSARPPPTTWRAPDLACTGARRREPGETMLNVAPGTGVAMDQPDAPAGSVARPRRTKSSTSRCRART